LTRVTSAPRAPILYLSHSYVPSRHANSIQVMKMCEAFALHAGPVELFCRRERPSPRDPFAHYGVNPCFRVRSLWVPRVPVLGRLAYTALGLLRVLLAPRPRLIYARVPYLLGVLAALRLCRAPSVLEVHQPPQDPVERALMRRIFADPLFTRLVAISQALDAYRELFGEALAGRIVVPPTPRLCPRLAPRTAAACGTRRSFTLGYAGSLAPGKGIERIAALALVCRTSSSRSWEAPEGCASAGALQSPELALSRFRGAFAGGAGSGALRRTARAYQPSVRSGPARGDRSLMSPLKIRRCARRSASDLPAVREVLRDGTTHCRTAGTSTPDRPDPRLAATRG
jgi:hypothetical protein